MFKRNHRAKPWYFYQMVFLPPRISRGGSTLHPLPCGSIGESGLRERCFHDHWACRAKEPQALLAAPAREQLGRSIVASREAPWWIRLAARTTAAEEVGLSQRDADATRNLG